MKEQKNEYQIFYVDTLFTGKERLKDVILAISPNGKIEYIEKKEDSEEIIDLIKKKPNTEYKTHNVEVVLPTLTDAHAHPISYASIELAKPCDIFGINNEKKLSDTLKKQFKNKKGIQLVLGWDTSILNSLTKHKLDKIRKEPFFCIDLSFHGAVGNTSACELITEYIEKNNLKIDGYIDDNGIMTEDYALLCLEIIEKDLGLESIVKSVENQISLHKNYGTFWFHEMCILTPLQFSILEKLNKESRKAITTVFCDKRMLQYAIKNKINVSSFGLKLFVDGSNQSNSALYNEPYLETNNKGNQYCTLEEATIIMKIALDNNVNKVAVHAIGTKGIEIAIKFFDIWEILCKKHSIKDNFRIEHMSLPTQEEIKQVKEKGILVCPQPNFLVDTILFKNKFKQKQLEMMTPLKLMSDFSLNMVFGTDNIPNSMLLAIHCAVNAPYKNQKISLAKAIYYSKSNVLKVGEDATFILGDNKLIELLSTKHGLFKTNFETFYSKMEEIKSELEKSIKCIYENGKLRK